MRKNSRRHRRLAAAAVIAGMAMPVAGMAAGLQPTGGILSLSVRGDLDAYGGVAIQGVGGSTALTVPKAADKPAPPIVFSNWAQNGADKPAAKIGDDLIVHPSFNNGILVLDMTLTVIGNRQKPGASPWEYRLRTRRTIPLTCDTYIDNDGFQADTGTESPTLAIRFVPVGCHKGDGKPHQTAAAGKPAPVMTWKIPESISVRQLFAAWTKQAGWHLVWHAKDIVFSPNHPNFVGQFSGSDGAIAYATKIVNQDTKEILYQSPVKVAMDPLKKTVTVTEKNNW